MFGTASIAPLAITAAPDGTMWFTGERQRSVEQITTAGLVAARSPTAMSPSGPIAAGHDGTVWFAEGGGSLARATPDGAVVEYPSGSAVVNIATASDGSLWFTTGAKVVGRMTPSGSVTYLTDRARLRGTYGIARGPDGAMWVTNYLGSSIARIDGAGVVTTFTSPCVRYPMGITAGPDHALWFADDSGEVGRVTTTGKISCFGSEARVGHPDAIVSGGDGALWAADRLGSIVRVTRQGRVTRYATPGMRLPDAIAAGPRGTVWFTDYDAPGIGRITRTGPRTQPATPAARPRVTLITDSVGASIAFDVGATSILARGLDLFLEPGEARTLGPGPPGGIAPPTVLQVVSQLGRRLGQTVVIEVGNNDYPDSYAANMEVALSRLHAAGVKHVLWVTLHVTLAHQSYATMNDAITAASVHHPELRVLDWNSYAAGHPEWFQSDGVHLTGDGPRAFARFPR